MSGEIGSSTFGHKQRLLNESIVGVHGLSDDLLYKIIALTDCRSVSSLRAVSKTMKYAVDHLPDECIKQLNDASTFLNLKKISTKGPVVLELTLLGKLEKAISPFASSEQLRIFSESDVGTLRFRAAKHGNAPEASLRKLAKDIFVSVRYAVASNKKSPIDALNILKEDPSISVRYVANVQLRGRV